MSEIRAGTTTTTALVTTGDTSGNIVLTADSGIVTANATGALTVPSGTTAQRPATPIAGQLRYNTTTSNVEVYNGVWQTIASNTYSIEFLLVAGGGAGNAGGGGAGTSMANNAPSRWSVAVPPTQVAAVEQAQQAI